MALLGEALRPGDVEIAAPAINLADAINQYILPRVATSGAGGDSYHVHGMLIDNPRYTEQFIRRALDPARRREDRRRTS
jgi:hypothetical protein